MNIEGRSMPTLKPEVEILAGRIVKGMSFNEKVWAVCARVPKGKVTTYASIARKLGTQAYRAVGNAMNKNPYAPRVPCHRVVGSDGSLTGFAQGLEKKKRMLKAEGVAFVNGKVDLQQSAAEL
jgi:methylated-DNA-[protein]-cysteine S-methyltransferase